MSLIKITDLTKQLGLSSRTLRYYEQEGLIESTRMPYESYRYYDESAVQRLRQIMILRKMQIPVREIIRIYENPEISTLVEVFTDKIAEIDREVTSHHPPPGDGRIRRELLVQRLRQICDGMSRGNRL